MKLKKINLKSWKHFGSPVGCVHLGSCDIGRAKMPGQRGKYIYTTWGRNLTAEQADRLGGEHWEFVESAAGHYEIVLDGRILAGILAGIAVNKTLFELEKQS